MSRRLFSPIGTLATVAFVAAATFPVSTQNSPAPPVVITTYSGGPPPANWATPKTPWGEPDLQGVWSSGDMDGVPRPRPAQCGNRV
jgi:hypothetical protein